MAGVTEAQSLRVDQNDERITLYDGNNVVLTYNKVSPVAPEGIDSMYERSGCLHPVCTPEGRTVTTMFPFDHPHQHGVFSAWVKTKYDGQAIDFWNLAGGTGRVLHEQVASVFQKNTGIGFEVDLIHRAETAPKVDVLRERWRITAYPTDGTYRCFDLQTTQSAITSKPLTVSKYHYGGIVLRGPTRWLTAKDRGGLQRPDLTREPSGFLNNLGSDRIAGNHQHAKWVALWGEIVAAGGGCLGAGGELGIAAEGEAGFEAPVEVGEDLAEEDEPDDLGVVMGGALGIDEGAGESVDDEEAEGSGEGKDADEVEGEEGAEGEGEQFLEGGLRDPGDVEELGDAGGLGLGAEGEAESGAGDEGEDGEGEAHDAPLPRGVGDAVEAGGEDGFQPGGHVRSP
jgi:hypothetical protein